MDCAFFTFCGLCKSKRKSDRWEEKIGGRDKIEKILELRIGKTKNELEGKKRKKKLKTAEEGTNTQSQPSAKQPPNQFHPAGQKAKILRPI